MNWKVLFVGPANFNAESWKTRAEYILPDLFDSVGSNVELHLLTADVPDFGRDALDVLLRRFDVRHYEVPGGERLNRTESWIAAVTALAKSIRPDVITNLFGSQWLGEVIAVAAVESGAKSIIRVPGDEIGSRVSMGVYKKGTRRLASALATEKAGFLAADRIIAMSPWEAGRIRTAIGTPTDKVTVCIRGVDLNRFFPLPVGASEVARKRFLYVGRKSAEKGYDLLEAAAKKVYLEDPDIEFIFVGNFDPQRVDNRTYLGWVDTRDLPELYRSVDAFVLTSRSEGFPQVVAEAMASGLPCILSSHLFGPVFRHAEDVLLCDLSEADIAKQVLHMARNEQMARRLAKRSRELAESTLDQRMWKRRYEDIMHLRQVEAETVLDPTRSTGDKACKGRLRIAYILPRVFGVMGTQGSYGPAKAFSAVTPTMVISRLPTGPVTLPIVSDAEGLTAHHRIDFSRPTAGKQIAALLAEFRPDVVHFVNDHSWVKLLPILREEYPTAKYVLDLQTPLLVEGSKREVLQQAGRACASKIDLVVALSSDIARSWIPGFNGRLLTYPLGIDVEAIRARAEPSIANAPQVRFIYIGQLHPLRKIPKLLELVGGLPDSLRERFSLDIVGAGGGEDEIDAQITALGLAGTVRRRPPVPQTELFSMMGDYDCGVAWVPTEVYNEAPSLKFLEHAAARIGIIATDTVAHRRNVADGFDVPLFQETAGSFEEAVRSVMQGHFTQEVLDKNATVVRRYGFPYIVGNVLLPAFQKLSDERRPPAQQPRLLFVTPRPLGLMATPGTYLSVEAYAEHCDLRVISKPVTGSDETIVHTSSTDLSVALLDPERTDYDDLVREEIRRFQPHLLCLASWPGLHRLIGSVRSEFPAVKICLEVKSPVINRDPLRRAQNVSRWERIQHCLDAIVAPSRGMVDTYLPNFTGPFLQHRSIIDYSNIAKKDHAAERVLCRRFVFSGSLAKLRQIDKLLRLISQLPSNIRTRIEVDFFGDGPVREELEALAKDLGLDGIVSFKGAVPQIALFRLYRDYDAGIAWVPTELYDSAPSLKLIEYCASGIAPIATSSSGHLLLKHHGFHIDYFDEHGAQSFTDLMTAICTEGVRSAGLRDNERLAERFDYRKVIGGEILPFYMEILAQGQKAAETAARENLQSDASDGLTLAHAMIAWRARIQRDETAEVQDLALRRDLAYERALHAKRMRARERGDGI